MRTDTNRSVSFNRNQLRNVNFGHIEEELIDNYPILVRGVISEIGGFGEASDDIAEILIGKYPTFVRGVIEAFQAGDIEESVEDPTDSTSSETATSPQSRMNSPSSQNRTDNQPQGKKWRRNQRRNQNKRFDA